MNTSKRLNNIVFVLLLASLMGCQMATPSAIPTPTSTATASATPSPVPSSTPTITPSPTFTVTPTPEPTREVPYLIVQKLSMSAIEGYEIEVVEETRNLIKRKSGIRLAVVENQKWRKLDPENEVDLEMMYGHLVLEDTYMVVFNNAVPGMAIESLRIIHVIYLGEYEVTKAPYNGKEVRVPLLLAGLRSVDGKLHLLKFAVETPDLEPKRWYMAHGTNFTKVKIPLRISENFLKYSTHSGPMR